MENNFPTMFTGIVRQTGLIKKIQDKNGLKILTIKAPKITSSKRMGDSIAVDGACLTVTKATKLYFSVEAIPETLNRTIIKHYKEGTVVNLENPLKLSDSLDGHFVQGHIDFIGTVKNVSEMGDSKVIAISFPETMAKFFAFKGSVTVNGVSLTISKLNKDSFEVSLIPQTIKSTNLNVLAAGGEVNIEIDLLSRYLESLLGDREKVTTYEFLRERNFI